MPEHIRALTSRHVLDVEADSAGRFAARTGTPEASVTLVHADASEHMDGLDPGQSNAVRMLASDRALMPRLITKLPVGSRRFANGTEPRKTHRATRWVAIVRP